MDMWGWFRKKKDKQDSATSGEANNAAFLGADDGEQDGTDVGGGAHLTLQVRMEQVPQVTEARAAAMGVVAEEEINLILY